MSNTSVNETSCRSIFAKFLLGLERGRCPLRARWLCLIKYWEGNEQQQSNSSGSHVDYLSTLLGMDYKEMYLPFMLRCGLIHMGKKQPISTIKTGCTFRSYSWDQFISEYKLEIEVSYAYINEKKIFFARVGHSYGPRFTILDQLRSGTQFTYFSVRQKQQKFIKSLASELTSLVPFPTAENDSSNVESGSFKQSPETLDKIEHTNESNNNSDGSNLEDNFKSVLQIHFFDRICKEDVDTGKLMDCIDISKLKVGLQAFIGEIHRVFYQEQKKRLETIGFTGNELKLKPGITAFDFPVLGQYGIPLELPCISSLLRDVVKLSKSVEDTNVLCFPYNNDTNCNLVQVPTSGMYNKFKRNDKIYRWIPKVLSAIGAEEVSIAAEWMVQYLGEVFPDSFVNAASNIGLLLHSKTMDAEAACAMWEESNVSIRSQRIILRHLANFFGQRLTVPESCIRDLENRALHPVTDSVDVDGEHITFWYRHIDEAIIH
jgi:hypothetical protein